MFEAATRASARHSGVVHHVALLLRVGADETALDDIGKPSSTKDNWDCSRNQSPEACSGGQGVASPEHSVDASCFFSGEEGGAAQDSEDSVDGI